jgi:chemotaxis protein CheZ
VQILTILTRENKLWGIRLYDIQKILSSDLLIPDQNPVDSVIGRLEEGGEKIVVHDLRRILDTPLTAPPAKILLIGSTTGNRFGLAVEKLGRVLRIQDNSLHPAPALLPGFHCLTGPDIKGSELVVIDPDGSSAGKEMPSQTSSSENLTSSATDSLPEDFLTQIGKTAREIQKILSLSDSMLDTMKLVENHLPTTSGGLETVSRMTEEAAHTLLAVLEASLEANQDIRTTLRQAGTDPARLQQDIPAIESLLASQETRILEGFEAMVFQDLVGQNLRKITQTLNDLEKRLLTILMEFSPEREGGTPSPPAGEAPSGLEALDLKGVPSESTFSQDSVDKLLSEFGF